MGITIKMNLLADEKDSYRLLVYCSVPLKINDNLISVNNLLAKKLLSIKPSQRTMKIEECFNEIISTLPEKVVIKDIDVMFNPKYRIDVLRILVEANKRHPFILVWPGTIDNNRLLYSEETLADYKSYEISDYDIVCVV